MASLDDLQALLQNTTMTVSEETQDSFSVSFWDIDFSIPKPELDDFIKIKDVISAEPETSIFYPGHYEHLIESYSPIPLRRPFRDDDDNFHLSNQDNSLSLEVSSPSLNFILKILQVTDFHIIRQRTLMNSMQRERLRGESNPHLREAFRRFSTIKIDAIENSPHFNKKAKLLKVAEASLFHFAYGYGFGYNLSQSWERTIYRLNRRRRDSVQFPRRTYNSDLVSYYQLALSSDSLMLGYLALYKILEYFYLSAAEVELHKRLVEKLIAPEFSHSKVSQLRQLTSIVKKHDQRMDEQRMLSTVIEHYFMPDEIVDWVNEYENSSERYYTTSQTVFGQTHSLDINPDNIAASLAKRIYHIRNAIVHNKEGEAPRFIPFSGQERVLSKEIPIVLFLAEQLILKTGEDL
jgi:hypothetical protein